MVYDVRIYLKPLHLPIQGLFRPLQEAMGEISGSWTSSLKNMKINQQATLPVQNTENLNGGHQAAIIISGILSDKSSEPVTVMMDIIAIPEMTSS